MSSSLANILIADNIIDRAAIEDAQNYDGGFILSRVTAAEKELGVDRLRAEIIELKDQLVDARRQIAEARL